MALSSSSVPSNSFYSSLSPRKTSPVKRYKCQFCCRAFSRSEHRNRHERSHTKERPFKCHKCRSTFVRKDLLLRHERTVHAKDSNTPIIPRNPHHQNNPKHPLRSSSISPPPPSPSSNESSLHHFHSPTTPSHLSSSSPCLDNLTGLETAAQIVTYLNGENNPVTPLESSNHPKSTLSSWARSDMCMGIDFLTIGNSSPAHIKSYSPTSPLPKNTNSLPSPNNDTSINETITSFHKRQFPRKSILELLNPAPDSHNIPNSNHQSTSHQAEMLEKALDFRLYPMKPECLRLDSKPIVQSCEKLSRSYLSMVPSKMNIRLPCIENENAYSTLINRILTPERKASVLQSFSLPNLSEFNRYIAAYFQLCHYHIPILHVQTFDPINVSDALLLSLVSTGAFFESNKTFAYASHAASRALVQEFFDKNPDFSYRVCPFWVLESTLMNMIFATWSETPNGLEWVFSMQSLLASMALGCRYQYQIRVNNHCRQPPCHSDWVKDEEFRRVFHSVYLLFALLALLCNLPPALGTHEFEEVDLPSWESLWELTPKSDSQWRQAFATTPSPILFRDAHCALANGEMVPWLGAFGCRIMVTAIFLDGWHLKYNMCALHDSRWEANLGRVLNVWKLTFDKCQDGVTRDSKTNIVIWHPLLVNALAMYRCTRARLLVDMKPVQEAVRYHNKCEIAMAMVKVCSQLKKSEELMCVLQDCLESIDISMRRITSWSVEQPLLEFEQMAILSLWLSRVENDVDSMSWADMEIYSRLKALLVKESIEVDEMRLSNTLFRLWDSLMRGGITWGIVTLMTEAVQMCCRRLLKQSPSSALGQVSTNMPMKVVPTLFLLKAY